MAKCDEGYLCEVCGEEVAEITESDLYLRYVIGDLEPESLHILPERHIRCNPTLAQFIMDDEFEPVELTGAFAKRNLDGPFVRERQLLVTRGWRRLREVIQTEEAIINYPLPEIQARMQSRNR